MKLYCCVLIQSPNGTNLVLYEYKYFLHTKGLWGTWILHLIQWQERQINWSLGEKKKRKKEKNTSGYIYGFNLWFGMHMDSCFEQHREFSWKSAKGEWREEGPTDSMSQLSHVPSLMSSCSAWFYQLWFWLLFGIWVSTHAPSCFSEENEGVPGYFCQSVEPKEGFGAHFLNLREVTEMQQSNHEGTEHQKKRQHHLSSDTECSSVLPHETSLKALQLLVFNMKSRVAVDTMQFISVSPFFCSWETTSERKPQMAPSAYQCSFLKLETWITLISRINILLPCSQNHRMV